MLGLEDGEAHRAQLTGPSSRGPAQVNIGGIHKVKDGEQDTSSPLPCSLSSAGALGQELGWVSNSGVPLSSLWKLWLISMLLCPSCSWYICQASCLCTVLIVKSLLCVLPELSMSLGNQVAMSLVLAHKTHASFPVTQAGSTLLALS